MSIPIRHAEDYPEYPHVLLEQHLLTMMAYDRSPKWKEFLDTGPILEPLWYNEIVDWLIETYPDQFVLMIP